MIRTKSVFSPIDRKKDGLRIQATRFRGRGMPVIPTRAGRDLLGIHSAREC